MNDYLLMQLIEGCTQNNATSQKQLYQHCFGYMMKICLRYNKNMDDAAACYNQAMAKVFASIKTYRNDGPFMGWISKIVVNTCITELKKRTRFERKLTTVSADDNINTEVAPQATTANEILELIQKLPTTYSLVFNLYVMEGYTHEEISRILGIAEGTSKWYLSEARSKLKQSLNAFSRNEATTTFK